MKIETQGKKAATLFEGPSVSPGKLRGIQQIANQRGGISVVAVDHQFALKALLQQSNSQHTIGYVELVKEKLRIVSILNPYASAFLLDAPYGAAQAIATGVLTGDKGLIVALEKPRYEGSEEARINASLEGWNVAKIKRLGASAVKCELYYHPWSRSAQQQEAFVLRIAEECRKYDIAFLLEPVSYPIQQGQRKDSRSFAYQRPQIVLESACRLSKLGVDLLKCEFPVDTRYERDERRIRQYCRRLTCASTVPWVLLSAAVPFNTFLQQVRIACQEGASGFTAGRSIWQDALTLPDAQGRERHLCEVALERLRLLQSMIEQHAYPWYEKYPKLEITEGWYHDYTTIG